MIISQLTNGFGNQMFQYAAARALAAANNTELKLDLQWYERTFPDTTPRRFQMDIFNITAPIASKKEIKKMVKKSPFGLINKFKRFLALIGLKHKKLYSEKHYHYDPGLQKRTPPLYMEGYFQSYKYFQNIENIIRKEFTLKKQLPGEAKKIAETMDKSESISLHIRRGDYVSRKVTSRFHGTCTPQYYQKAIDTVIEKISAKEPQKAGNIRFFVFSDDTAWVKENIKIPGAAPDEAPANIHYVTDLGFRDYEEMALMAHCKHNILANSSFSWWGAWLNPDPHKIVIAPIHWFAEGKINTADLIPPEWVRV
jgi:hypothetical protein